MGVFNVQSSDKHYQFAKGIQGAPGVGFNLTADGNFDITNKKLTNVADGTDKNDAVTKQQLDNVSGDVTSDIDLKNTYNIVKSNKRTLNQLSVDYNSLASFEEVRENFVGINESFPMKTYLDMGTNYIYNVKSPTNIDQATNKGYVDSAITADYQKRQI